ncbi:MAG TPA: helix-turn-helix domain-containing GNAT family N-acetyltransferase [Burkholderiales bacterium]|nr:helix-turn-helix domain-containing GNAT family N-acetyltransferase [Burkholderiales bacterium]
MSQVDAVRRFNRFYTRRIGVLQSSYLGSPFPLPQARVLYEIGHRGECTASELGGELDIDLGYLSRLIQGLKRQCLVQGEPARHDARHIRLTLTPKGRKAFAALDETSRRTMGEMLAPLARRARERLVSALQTVETVLEPRAANAELTLRPHRAGDMGWVVERHGVLYGEEYGWGALFEALVADIVAKFLRDFDPRREHCWIAERRICDHAERVGSVFLVRESASTAKLRLLLIEPHVRGAGLGKRLVEECIAFARKAGYRKLVLWTHANLLAARAIYTRLGFRKVKSEPHRQFGVPVVGEYWELALGGRFKRRRPRGT